MIFFAPQKFPKIKRYNIMRTKNATSRNKKKKEEEERRRRQKKKEEEEEDRRKKERRRSILYIQTPDQPPKRQDVISGYLSKAINYLIF